MPHTDTYTSVLLVEVEGRPLPADVAPLLLRGRIVDSASLPDSFELEFLDTAGTLLSTLGVHIGSAVTLTASTSGSDQPAPMLDGEVTALDREDMGGSLHTRIRGLDRSHRLFRGRRVAAYVDSSISDIVGVVAQRAKLSVGKVSAPSTVFEHVTQDNVSDWVFLKRLADRVGSVFAVKGKALDFGPPTEAADAPDGEGGAKEDPVVIQYGINSLYLRSTVTSSEQVPEVEVRGWDPREKKAVVSVAPAKTRSAQLADIAPADLAKTFGSPRYSIPAGDGNAASQERLAESVAERIAGGFLAEFEAHVLGNPALRSGTAVALNGFGSPFDGRYTVTDSIHDFDAQLGYTTSITVGNTSDRSLFGITAGAQGALAGGTMPGLVNAIVTDIDDPDRRGRVRLSFPHSSDDYVSGWVRTAQLGAGKARGWVVQPEVGDEVLVGFEGGRFERPYVIAGLYNGVDEPATPWSKTVESGSVATRSFTSRTGMALTFREAPGEEKLEVTTNDGAQRITLLQTGEKGIQIIAEGPVTVTAKNDVSVTTETGRIGIAGATVSIEATGELALSGASVTMKGDASAEVSAPNLNLTGSASAGLTSSGMTTVKGATVMIN